MNSSSYDALSNQGFDVEAAASYSGFGFSVNAEASMTENQKAHSTEFNKYVEVFTTSVSAGSFFLAVQDSSIGDLVTQSVSE